MPIVIGIFFLLPLFFGALVEYLCCRLPRRRFWRFLPPVIAVVFLIVAVWPVLVLMSRCMRQSAERSSP